MDSIKRKYLAVSIKHEVHAEIHAIASEVDLTVTAWVRQAVMKELKRIRAEQEGA